MDAEKQRRNVAVAAQALAGIAPAEHELIVTHGNGPQVRLLALQVEAYPEGGAIRSTSSARSLRGHSATCSPRDSAERVGTREIATLLTQVVVDPGDPAFAAPSKPIGPVYDADISAEREWTMRPDGRRWRRVVASPEPQAIVELPTIRRLVEAGVLVIARAVAVCPSSPARTVA